MAGGATGRVAPREGRGREHLRGGNTHQGDEGQTAGGSRSTLVVHGSSPFRSRFGWRYAVVGIDGQRLLEGRLRLVRIAGSLGHQAAVPVHVLVIGAEGVAARAPAGRRGHGVAHVHQIDALRVVFENLFKGGNFNTAFFLAGFKRPCSSRFGGSVDTETFKKIVADDPVSVMLIDVRDPDEFEKGSFATAINIPVDKLENKIKTLPLDKPIIFVCGTGARSGESFYMIQDLRPEMKNVYYLEGELTFKKDGSFEITEPVS